MGSSEKTPKRDKREKTPKKDDDDDSDGPGGGAMRPTAAIARPLADAKTTKHLAPDAEVFTVIVGKKASRAKYHVARQYDVLPLLETLLDSENDDDDTY